MQEYTFKIQIPKDDKTLTMGKGIIDLGQHASLDSEPKNLTVPIKFAAGSRGLGNGELLITVNSEMMKGFSAEDGMTVMSGLSGLSSPFDNQYDQDLSGENGVCLRLCLVCFMKAEKIKNHIPLFKIVHTMKYEVCC